MFAPPPPTRRSLPLFAVGHLPAPQKASRCAQVQLPPAVQEGPSLRAVPRLPGRHKVHKFSIALPDALICNSLRMYYDRTFKMLQDIPTTARVSEHKVSSACIARMFIDSRPPDFRKLRELQALRSFCQVRVTLSAALFLH